MIKRTGENCENCNVNMPWASLGVIYVSVKKNDSSVFCQSDWSELYFCGFYCLQNWSTEKLKGNT